VTSPAETGLPADLRAFLDAEPGEPAADLAYTELYVKEQVLGKNTSRFVHEGGVHLNSVTVHRIDAASFPELARQRRGFADFQQELLKFRFTIDELPPSRWYTSVRVRITLHPRPTVLLFKPPVQTTHAETETTSSSQVSLEVERLIQLHLTRSREKTVRRSEQAPVITALDHGAAGFGWTFQAQDGAPLFPQMVLTQALIEVPRGTAALAGLFDSEALIGRRVLRSAVTRSAMPQDSAEPFALDLTKPTLDGRA
jgi:hypothetical protein